MRIIYFLSFLFLIQGINAQFEPKSIKLSAQYLVDSTSQYNRNDLPKSQWQRLPYRQHINLGYNINTSIWCRYRFTNTSSHEQEFGLTFYNNNLDSLVCYESNKTRILGDRTRERAEFLSYHSFLMRLQPYESKSCYVKLKKYTSFFEFSYGLESKNALTTLSKTKLIVISIFIGVIIVLIVLNISLFAITKKSVYLYYTFYSICSILYIVSYSNFAKFTLFPDFVYFSEVHIYTSTLWFITLSLLISNFVGLPVYFPNKYRVLRWSIYATVIVVLLSIAFYFLQWNLALKICFYLVFSNLTLTLLYLVIAVFQNSKHRPKRSYLMLFTFLPHLIWGHAIILRSFKIIYASFPENTLVYVFLYETLMFGIILTNKYLKTYRENSKLVNDLLHERDKTIQVISQTQVRERRSIANLIHDNIGSQLAYIRQLIQLKQYTQMNTSLDDLSNDIRMISHQILPKSLDDGALFASLHNHISSRSRSNAVPKIELYNYNFPEIIEAEWIYDVYLICLELLHNASKHGRAKVISIEFYGYTTHYLIQVTDDGQGFDTTTVAIGFGLENSQKRIHNYKGEFEITSTLLQGTIIQIKLPKA